VGGELNNDRRGGKETGSYMRKRLGEVEG